MSNARREELIEALYDRRKQLVEELDRLDIDIRKLELEDTMLNILEEGK
jgi:hypothetical protein